MNRLTVLLLLLVPLLTAVSDRVRADADGPDYFSVIDVAPDDTLNMRPGPSAHYPKIGELPHDADGVANLGCIGGLTFEEWLDASEEAREANQSKVWCLVGYDREVGWVPSRYLTEGTHTDGFRAGDVLANLPGSEWRATRTDKGSVDGEWTVRFGSDGRLSGNGGCNQLVGSFERNWDEITIGPIASTRKLCAEHIMKTESKFIEMLEKAAFVSAHHLILVLLSADSEILAQLARTDWD
ncbi:META domain-containing protein [Aliiruegeria sabulilitoris]|uniref:META domain-containing protein n=1 Tax=Aliiruegeria sabulilitoris TaxID=1510458 RepID=UPI000833E961|nr:META domain-containing protein [Aliiruegeria sabulilitoris]